MKKIIFITYSLLLVLLTVFSYAFVDPNLIYYKKLFSNFAFQNRAITTAAYILFIILLFIFYLIILRSVNSSVIPVNTGIQKREAKRWIPGLRPGMTTHKDIKILIGITCLFLFFSYPAMLSYDIFNYMTTAKVLFSHHENPYIIMPIEFLGDPFLLYTHAANKLALYAPGWIALTGIPYILGMGSFFLTLLNFKLVAVVFYLLTAFLIWKMSRNVLTLVLFAFNPLIIIESLVSAHNDIVMIFLALFSFYLIKQKKYVFAVCFFFASILIKYATIFLLPVFIFMLWRVFNNKEIDWKKIYYISFLSMLAIFLLSPLREEMYPWYAVWFLPFVFLIPERKNILYLSIALSIGLMLRYVPFMYTGNHFGMTPVLRIALAAVPVLIVGGMMGVKK